MKKRGFTLIELLAVIVILGILLIIAVPKISNVIDNAQKGAYKSTNSVIVSELNRQNGLEITPQVYTFTNGVMSPDIGITGELPKNGTVEVNSLGQIQIVTSNDKYCAIKRFDEDNVAIFNVGERNCNVIVEITLTVNPNGGTYEGSTSNTTYSIPTEDFQTINDPTRAGYTFDGWTIEGEGTYSSWLFQAGYTDTTLTAKWKIWPTLTVNLNSGSTSQTFNASYAPNTEITLITPTRSGYVFNGWTVSGTGSSINGTTLKTGSENATLAANWLAYTSMYTYTGSSTVIDDGSGNWRIKFLTSGNLTLLVDLYIDAFLVGGGGGGKGNIEGFGGGGGGGYTSTRVNISLAKNTVYSIVVGAGGAGGSGSNGGATSAFTYTANGGLTAPGSTGGAGGSGGGAGSYGGSNGGAGGTNGGNGAAGWSGTGGIGQGSTTREFSELTGTIYSGGGGGSAYGQSGGPYYSGGAGGVTGGGAGQAGGAGRAGSVGVAGTPNTGGGGGGGVYGEPGLPGGSGIVIIRNNRIKEVGATTKYRFTYSGTCEIIDGNTDNWKVKFLENGIFTPLSNYTIDAFLVGGGGGGAGNIEGFGGGGGGGYTRTQNDISLISGTSYSITIGLGGLGGSGSNGGATSAFAYTANGGLTASGSTGGAGGSGGGAGSYGGSNGGAGGTNGGNGAAGWSGTGGIGQGSTTREFSELTGTIYSGGGGGSAYGQSGGPYYSGGAGGVTGGGAGQAGGAGRVGSAGVSGTPNTGGGGGGGVYAEPGLPGGSGIVVIRPS